MTSVLKLKVRSKRRVSLPVDPQAFESVGSILRRLRADLESQMTTEFSRPLSLKLDHLLDAEQRYEEDRP